MRQLLLCVALLLAPLVASARPALWVVQHADATIYLFGTVHVLPGDTRWRFPALEQALARSQVLYLEATDDNPALLASLVTRYGMESGRSLSSRLDTTDNQALVRAATAAGLPRGVATLEPMKPWLAALTLAIAPLKNAGMDPAKGVDRQLKAQMQKAGKPVRGLEHAGDQIRALAGLSPAQQRVFLRAAMQGVDTAVIDLRWLIAAWQQGDVAAIGQLGDEDLRHTAPALYQALVVTRNQRFAGKIVALMRQPGVIFIAVGAAHLAGPHSLQRELENRGLKIRRE